MNTLIIIDMQPYFRAYEKALPGVLKEIKIAKKNKEHIIVVHLVNCGQTGKEILKAISSYDKVYFVTKAYADGSPHIIRLAETDHIPIKKLTVCGINLSECVSDTIKGLLKRNETVHINVPLSAVNDNIGIEWALKEFKEFKKNYNNRLEIT